MYLDVDLETLILPATLIKSKNIGSRKSRIETKKCRVCFTIIVHSM